MTFLIETMPANLDPRIGTDAQSQRLHSLLFSALLERDAQMNLRGDLAERWESPGPLTYVFHLRRGVRFHDGRPLTSADVKFTFDTILSGAVKTPKRGAFRMVSAVEAPDADTVIFRLREPFASFLWNLARPSVGIVPAGAAADFAQQPVGTGPFRFISARQDEEVVLEHNADYFGRTPAIAQVRFRIVPDAIVRALELRKGTADLALNSLAPDMLPVLARQPDLQVTEQPGTIYSYVAFNLDDPALAHRTVRQALAYATDRQALVTYLLRGQARLADGLLPPNHWAYEPNVPHYTYDPARAEQLLDAAGYPRAAGGGMRLKLTLKSSTEELTRLLGAVLQEQWRRVGVDLELRPLELATLLDDARRGNFQMYTLRWVGANNDPDIFEFVFHSRKIPPADGANRGHYRNARLDALLDLARVEADRERRKRLYSEVQRIVAEDLPYLNLWYSDNICVHRRRIAQVELTPSGDYDFLGHIVLR
ncbi:MAG: ABC transporter substrate-binding protein [Acidobacteria bacterium]|nr:ABC transporter substrate-binding protein [Acidobacteriota bacterium]